MIEFANHFSTFDDHRKSKVQHETALPLLLTSDERLQHEQLSCRTFTLRRRQSIRSSPNHLTLSHKKLARNVEILCLVLEACDESNRYRSVQNE